MSREGEHTGTGCPQCPPLFKVGSDNISSQPAPLGAVRKMRHIRRGSADGGRVCGQCLLVEVEGSHRGMVSASVRAPLTQYRLQGLSPQVPQLWRTSAAQKAR